MTGLLINVLYKCFIILQPMLLKSKAAFLDVLTLALKLTTSSAWHLTWLTPIATVSQIKLELCRYGRGLLHSRSKTFEPDLTMKFYNFGWSICIVLYDIH